MFNTIHRQLILLLLLILGCTLSLRAEEEQTGSGRANIDVLVVFDTSAREYILDRKRNKGDATLNGKAEAAMEEINQVLQKSGLGDFINFRCCGIFELNYTTQAGDSGYKLAKDLAAIRSDNSPDGTLIYYQKKTAPLPEEVRVTLPSLDAAMENSGADLAIMFVWNKLTPQKPCILGVAGCYNIGVLTADIKEPSRHAVFNIETLNTASATFSHEVCHLLGAGHSDVLYLNPGPQSETDAAAALCYTTDNGKAQAHTSLMGYVSEYDTRKKELRDAYYRDATIHKVLSGPVPFEFNRIELQLGDKDKENNTAVVLRHASVVALYHYRGDEVAINDDFSAAIPLPPLTCWKDKKSRLLRSIALSHLQEYAQEKYGTESNKILREYWKKRDEVIDEIVKSKCLESKYISPALPAADEQGLVRLACIIGTTTGAKRESNEGEPKLKNGCGNTVWYKLTPSVSGTLELGIRKTNTTPGFDPVMGIFKGNSLSTLRQLPISPVADDRSEYFSKRIKATVNADETLYIAIDNKAPTVNQFNLLVTLTAHSNSCFTPPGEVQTSEKPENTDDVSDSEGILIPEKQTSSTDNQPEWVWVDSAILTFAIGCITAAIISAIQIISAGFSVNSDPLIGKLKDKKMQFGNIQIGAPKRLRTPITKKDRKFVLSGKLSNGKKKTYTIAMKDFDADNNFTIGSDSSNSLVIRDKTVEKNHCVFKIRHVDNELVLLVADLGTEKGTIIDKTKLTIPNASVKVTDGSDLVLGECLFKITTTAPSMLKVIFLKFARLLRLILFITSLIFAILAIVVLYESRKEREAKDLAGRDSTEQTSQPEEQSVTETHQGYDKNSTLIVIDSESNATSTKIKYIDLGAFQHTDEIKYDKPDSEGTLRICRVPLPEGALDWTQPMQEPACGDVIKITLPDNKKYSFEVTSVDVEEEPYKKIVVHGKLLAADGHVTMMLLDKRLLMQIEDTNPDEPRVYNVSFAEEYTAKDGPEIYIVQEIDPRLVAHSTPLLLTDEAPQNTQTPTNGTTEGSNSHN